MNDSTDTITTEFVEKDGYKCFHINSTALSTSDKSRHVEFDQSILGKIKPNETYTYSCWYMTENVQKGTTDNFLSVDYTSGNYGSGRTWFAAWTSQAINTNTQKWVKIETTSTASEYCDGAIELRLVPFFRDFTGDIYIRDLKLEKGNKATDWTPAPEDTQSDIDDVTNTLTNTRGDVSSLQSTTTQLSSQVETALSGISTNVTAISQVQTNLNDFKKTTQSDIKQSADSLKIELSNSIENTNKSLDNVNTTVSEMKSYMNFTTDSNSKPVLELGASDSNFKTRLSNSELAFMQGETKVAYISESKLNITEADINTSLKIGNFAFVPRSNGSLDFKKVGGS